MWRGSSQTGRGTQRPLREDRAQERKNENKVKKATVQDGAKGSERGRQPRGHLPAVWHCEAYLFDSPGKVPSLPAFT